MKFTHSALQLTPFYPWVCLHHTFAVRNLIGLLEVSDNLLQAAFLLMAAVNLAVSGSQSVLQIQFSSM